MIYKISFCEDGIIPLYFLIQVKILFEGLEKIAKTC